MPFQRNILLLVVLTLLMGSCTVLHRVGEDEVYLKKHYVVFHEGAIPANDSLNKFDWTESAGLDVSTDGFNIPAEDLMVFSKLKPNKRILWARFNLGIYTLVPKKALRRSEIRASERCQIKNAELKAKGLPEERCQSFWMWLAYTVGEKPAELDTTLMQKGAQQMHIYLRKKGYFDNEVIPEVVYKKKGLIFWRKGQKVKVRYHVFPKDAYRYRNITYNFQDTLMRTHARYLRETSILKPDMIFDVSQLNAERERMSVYLNNHGYYDFTKDYITFDIDSSLKTHHVNVKMQLVMPQVAVTEYVDSLISVPHRKYFIGDIFVHTQFDPANPNYSPKDTTEFDGIKIVYDGKLNLDSSLISCLQGYTTGDLFSRQALDKTYKRYSQLGVLRATTIQIIPRPQQENGLNILDTHIRLTPLKRKYFRIEPQVTHRSGNMGVYSNVLFSYRNVFNGAEILDTRMIFGLEASQTLVETEDGANNANIQRSFRLNTFEIGPELTFKFPRLWPLTCDQTRKSSEPQTALSIAYNYQSRPDYVRTLSQLKFSWNAIENPDKISRFSIDWTEFSIIKIKKSPEFEQFLKNLNDVFLQNSYQDHLILGINFNYSINTQKLRYQRRYYYMRAGLGFAGNALNQLMEVTGAPLDDNGSYRVFGIRFAQYQRAELDLRYYSNVNEKNSFVLRGYGGYGRAEGNLKALPFEKSFFSGGSNGIRAWQARSLGPGSSRDSLGVVSFNSIGEIKLEGNFEYRFKMTSMLNWALFVDAGNIWLRNANNGQPGSDFRGSRFVSEIAIGSGIGLRLDFDIFLVRFDLGIKMKDPAKVPGERWIWQPKTEYLDYLRIDNPDLVRVPTRNNYVLNLGIGFPF